MSSTKQFVRVYPKSVYEQFKYSLCRFFKIENRNDMKTQCKEEIFSLYRDLNTHSFSIYLVLHFRDVPLLSPILNEWCTEYCVVFKSRM